MGTGFQACDLPKRQAVDMNQSMTFLKLAKDRLKIAKDRLNIFL